MNNNATPTAWQIMLRSLAIIPIVLCGAMGLAFFIWISFVAINESNLKSNGIITTAKVTNKEIEGRKPRGYLITYHLITNKKHNYEGSSLVSKDVYNKTKIKQDVEVIYDSTDPDNNKMIEQNIANVPFSILILFSFIAPLFIIIAVMMIMDAMFRARLYRIGKKAKGVIKDIHHSTAVKDHDKYNIIYSFNDHMGTSHEITLKHQASHRAKKLKIGEEVDILYSPNKPKKNIITIFDNIIG